MCCLTAAGQPTRAVPPCRSDPAEAYDRDGAVHRRNPSRPRLCYILTHAVSTRFLRGQLAFMRARGYDVTLLVSPGQELSELRTDEGIAIHAIPMERAICPWRDLRSLLRLYLAVRRIRPDIVNAGTPKAGLLGMLAAWAARVPVRIYTLHGLRLETTSGWKRRLLTLTERIASRCATRVICVSGSLRDAYARCRLAPRDKLYVLANGTCNGLDVKAWVCRSEKARRSQRAEVRRRLSIPSDALVVGAVGRLGRDKGIVDVLAAWDMVRQHYPDVHLLLLGDLEATDPLPAPCLRRIADDSRIHWHGFAAEVTPYYDAMDILVHASYREGFPYAPLEAAAAGLPVVGYRVTGVVDAVADGVTGRLVAPHDIPQLGEALRQYAAHGQRRRRHGQAGRARVVRAFSQQTVWTALHGHYTDLLLAAGIPVEAVAGQVPLAGRQAA